jgi:hypothetical protein
MEFVTMSSDLVRDAEGVLRIVQDAGGKLVGRTRLQKIGFLLEVMGYGDGFAFTYKHYGPYSEQLASAAEIATGLRWLSEQEHQAAWGGFYSIFESHIPDSGESPLERKCIADFANRADAVELELAATAILLAIEGYTDPWVETCSRKASKAQGGRVERARELVSGLKKLDSKGSLPPI